MGVVSANIERGARKIAGGATPTGVGKGLIRYMRLQTRPMSCKTRCSALEHPLLRQFTPSDRYVHTSFETWRTAHIRAIARVRRDNTERTRLPKLSSMLATQPCHRSGGSDPHRGRYTILRRTSHAGACTAAGRRKPGAHARRWRPSAFCRRCHACHPLVASHLPAPPPNARHR